MDLTIKSPTNGLMVSLPLSSEISQKLKTQIEDGSYLMALLMQFGF